MQAGEEQNETRLAVCTTGTTVHALQCVEIEHNKTGNRILEYETSRNNAGKQSLLFYI